MSDKTKQKPRLDALLVERGIFESRSRAAASVMSGHVLVGSQRTPATKPGQRVAGDIEVELQQRPRFVSRGGLKLENALNSFPIVVEGRSCLDTGASTGGFTDCLLQAGAKRVLAVDVAYGEFHWSLRSDSRVTLLERQNIRAIEQIELPFRSDLLVADLSFIGLAKALPAIVSAAESRFDLVALVKPQFELERSAIGKGGVVRDAGDRLRALVAVGETAQEVGLSVRGYCSSGLPGPAGNRESFIWCSDESQVGVDDLEAAAAVTEEST